ncbi:ABC transporter permease [Microbacterium karelineae]|uniref:ABC transporter permease n=1 Tax=Microbacterium karelineae TaxID=2654283 RepID=UPI001E48D86E|nr:ABC transporter permease [Microbacterium karelineae]
MSLRGALGSMFRGRRRRRSTFEAEPAEAPTSADDAGESTGLLRPVARGDRFTASDLVLEATTDIGSRPGRLVVTIVGTVLGIGSLVATWGFAQTAAGQIASQFDAVAATQVTIVPEERSAGGQSAAIGTIPWDAPSRLGNLSGVEHAALLSDVSIGEAEITAVPINDPSSAQVAPPPVKAASAELLDVVEGTLREGRMFDAGHDERGDRVTVLGGRVADQLNIVRVDQQPSIFIDGIAYAVIGILDETVTRGELRDAVIIPDGAARSDFGLGAPAEAIARIAVGAGPQVAEQAALVLAPDQADTLKVRAPSAGSDLGSAVQADVNVVFLIVGGVALLAGGVGIANVTLLSVMERTGEIGLRRALGATRRQIGAQFTVESIVIGLLGGLIGAALGVIAVIVVAAVQQWTAVVDPLVACAGVVLGALVGWLSGWYPARRAARVEPVTALRGS